MRKDVGPVERKCDQKNASYDFCRTKIAGPVLNSRNEP